MATVSTPITPSDRLGFTIFLALSVHAVIILGVTFTYLDRKPSSHTMEVTLAQRHSNGKGADDHAKQCRVSRYGHSRNLTDRTTGFRTQGRRKTKTGGVFRSQIRSKDSNRKQVDR